MAIESEELNQRFFDFVKSLKHPIPSVETEAEWLQTAAKFLKEGADVNLNIKMKRKERITPLECAVQSGSIHLVKLMLKWGASVNAGGGAAFYIAQKMKFQKIAELLIEAGYRDKRPHLSGFPYSDRKENGDNLKVLQEIRMKSNQYAAVFQFLKSNNDLLQKNKKLWDAVINLKDLKGQTLLHIAAQRKDVEMVRFLTEGGALNYVVDHQEYTALDVAISLLLPLLFTKNKIKKSQRNKKRKEFQNVQDLKLESNLRTIIEILMIAGGTFSSYRNLLSTPGSEEEKKLFEWIRSTQAMRRTSWKYDQPTASHESLDEILEGAKQFMNQINQLLQQSTATNRQTSWEYAEPVVSHESLEETTWSEELQIDAFTPSFSEPSLDETLEDVDQSMKQIHQFLHRVKSTDTAVASSPSENSKRSRKRKREWMDDKSENKLTAERLPLLFSFTEEKDCECEIPVAFESEEENFCNYDDANNSMDIGCLF